MGLQCATNPLDRGTLDGGNAQHRVRIAHRHRAKLQVLTGHRQRIGGFGGHGCKREGARLEVGDAQINRDAPILQHSRAHHSAGAVHLQGAIDTAVSVHPEVVREASGPVPALLDLATVRIEYPVMGGRAGFARAVRSPAPGRNPRPHAGPRVGATAPRSAGPHRLGASMTRKSFPRPCIFVKAMRIPQIITDVSGRSAPRPLATTAPESPPPAPHRPIGHRVPARSSR